MFLRDYDLEAPRQAALAQHGQRYHVRIGIGPPPVAVQERPVPSGDLLRKLEHLRVVRDKDISDMVLGPQVKICVARIYFLVHAVWRRNASLWRQACHSIPHVRAAPYGACHVHAN